MVSDRALQIIEQCGENNFQVKKEAVKEIYGNERVVNLPLVILCIAGAARKGKSFMLNFFLDYLILKEKSPNKPWILNESTRLNGFEFQDGEDRTTLGIWAWSHLFVIENGEGKKVAVSLIDSQGTFDRYTSYEDCSAIFAMTSMFSSVMCFNVFNDLQEDKLNDFAAFIDHGKKIVENLDESGKLFQSLVFIVRDFRHKQYLTDENGGQKYVEKQLGYVENRELQKKRDNLKESCERMFGFIFPNPGPKVDQEKTSYISEIDQQFVKKAKHMVETLLSPNNLQIKKLGSLEFSCKNMIGYIPSCVKCFNENPKFAPRAVQSANREYIITEHVEREIAEYEQTMDKIFIGKESGFEPESLLKRHTVFLDKIKDKLNTNIKDEDIRHEVVDRIMTKIQSIFNKYCKQNESLIENERKRQNIIKQHNEQLEKSKAEAASKLAAQQQMERQRAAEAAAKYEREKQEAEKKHKKEVERQRQENERRKQEEIARIKREEEQKREDEIARIKRDNYRSGNDELSASFARMLIQNHDRSPGIFRPPSPNVFQQVAYNPYLGGYGGGGYSGSMDGYGNGTDYFSGNMGGSRSSSSSNRSMSNGTIDSPYGPLKQIVTSKGQVQFRDPKGIIRRDPKKK